MTGKTAIIVFLSLVLLAGFCSGMPDRSYGATRIEPTEIGSFPEEHHISGLTWIASDKAYCVPTCLRMIGEWAGIHEPVEYYTWLTGYSYGGFYKDSFLTFMPISDTMDGIRFGAPYLGLRRKLNSTADADLFVRAVKDALSRDDPVMIMYDYNTLTDETFFFPHAAILTGYSADAFSYYEPGFHNEFTPNAGPGKTASVEAFIRGIKTLQKKFTGTEGYSFMTFERVARTTDYAAVWKRNGENLKGIRIPFIDLSTGSRACEALAKEIRKKELPDWAWTTLLPVWLSFGEYSRKDNAAFLGDRFGTAGAQAEMIALLNAASTLYGEIMTILKDTKYSEGDYRERIPGLLMEIARIEKRLGRVLPRS